MLGKCNKCGGEPWQSTISCDWSDTKQLHKVFCEDCGVETGWYEYSSIAENVWDSWYATHDKLKVQYDEFEKTFTFGEAIIFMQVGHKVARKGWNGKGIFIQLQIPDENSKMTQPYIYIDSTELITDNPKAPLGRVPWLASQTDMLATDWYIVRD